MKREVRFDDDLPKTKKLKINNSFDDNHHYLNDNENIDEEFLEDAKKRKGGVITDGYESGESDSDLDENSPAQQGDDEDEDMFSEKVEKPAAEQSTTKSKSGIKYLAKEKIVGQEWLNQESSDDEDEKGEKKVTITPFNMDRELEEGNFDETGHYIQKKDDQAMHDTWLNGVTKKQMKKAKGMQIRREARRQFFDSLGEKGTESKDELWSKLLSLMVPGEAVLSTIRRIGGNNTSKPKQKSWKKKSNTSMDIEPTEAELKIQQDRKENLDLISSITSKLMTDGVIDVYETTYESIVRKLRISGILSDEWMAGDPVPVSQIKPPNNPSTKYYEYKWKAEDDTVYGPFSSFDLQGWSAGGFFDEHKGTMVFRLVQSDTPLDDYKGFVGADVESL